MSALCKSSKSIMPSWPKNRARLWRRKYKRKWGLVMTPKGRQNSGDIVHGPAPICSSFLAHRLTTVPGVGGWRGLASLDALAIIKNYAFGVKPMQFSAQTIFMYGQNSVLSG